ncbi:MAG TPA: effector-associated domain EAD1-containing protein [Methylobacter sp.]|jgi:nucleoside phosphorylase
MTSPHTKKTAEAAIDVLLICAMKDEYDQVLKVTEGLATDWQEHPLDSGWMVADARFTTLSGSTLSIRATHASYMGREQAQATASKLIHEQPARCIAMSGICAGRRGKVALGDVIFAERLWSYDAGKLTVEDGQERFQGDQLQYRPSQVWVQRMQHVAVPTPNTSWLSLRPALPLEQQEDWVLLRVLAGEEPSQHADFNTACPNWSDVLPRLWLRQWLEKPLTLTATGRQHAEKLNLLYHGSLLAPPDFNIHVAPMATGAAVSEDESIFPRLAESMRKVLGIEMEASALGALGEIHNIPVLIAKGVSDYGDSFKDDRYREFAARAAAECLLALLRKSADLLLGYTDTAKTSFATLENASARTIDLNLPLDLIAVLAEEYPDVRDARALWQRAGGKASEVDAITRPRDLWQRLWQRSMQGASARPPKLLQAALEDLPDNAVLLHYFTFLTS